MLDYRIYTFLELCKIMNYRKTAELLNMTQPAVTQHIKYLESEYNCKLFNYKGKTLSKTEKGIELERYARTLVSADRAMIDKIAEQPIKRIAIGATKTIGEYVIEELVFELMKRNDIELHLIVDNTKHLFQQLNDLKLDILILEGYFDKNCYGYEPIKREEVVGICAINHPFADKEIVLEEMFGESIIMREEGSGTREVLERFLTSKNYSVESFAKKTVLSSYRLIEKAVERNLGISFVYQSVVDCNKFATFKVKDGLMMHEFNYVFLVNSDINETLKMLKK